MKPYVLAAAIAALSACNQGSAQNDNRVAGNQASSPDTFMDPGEYEIRWTEERMISGVPNSEPEVSGGRECLKADDLKDSEKVTLTGFERCTDRTVTVKNGEVYATMRCRWDDSEPDSDGGFELRGTYDRTSSEITGDNTYPEGTIRVTRTMKRVGDC